MTLVIGTPGTTGFTLLAGDNFILPANVVVNAPGFGLTANTGAHTITIQGTLIGADGIDLDGNNSKLTIEAGGVVAGSGDDAIDLNAASATINNAGMITGQFGIYCYTAGATTDLITINNSGRIIAETRAVTHNGPQKMVLTNSGTIQTYDSIGSFASFDVSAVDVVINKGSMFGDVLLGGGVDSYDGRGGRLVGTVFGEAGVDKLTGGDLVDRMNGGAGADILTGGKGKDILSGGAADAAADRFNFNSTLEVGDVISHFTIADFIVIKSSAFGNVAKGTLASATFRANTTGLAGDASDRFIYETDSDRLWYDSNGNAAGGVKLMIADFVGDVAGFSRADILVV